MNKEVPSLVILSVQTETVESMGKGIWNSILHYIWCQPTKTVDPVSWTLLSVFQNVEYSAPVTAYTGSTSSQLIEMINKWLIVCNIYLPFSVAEAKKSEGNICYKNKDYTKAIQLYTEAIGS